MMQRLSSCVSGLHEVTRDWKFLAVFLLCGLLLCVFGELRKKLLSGSLKDLALYSYVAALLCIFPPTAAVLMIYFTAYDSYAMLYSIVPVTLLLAAFGCAAWFACRERFLSLRLPVRITFLAVLACALLLCGDFGQGLWRGDAAPKEHPVIAALRTHCPEGATLLAPDDVVKSLRVYAPEFGTLYGRDLADPSLQGYTYDKYAPAFTECREALTDFTFYADLADLRTVLQTARDAGADAVLVPGNENNRPEELSGAAETYGYSYEDLPAADGAGHYFLFTAR